MNNASEVLDKEIAKITDDINHYVDTSDNQAQELQLLIDGENN